MIQFIKLWDIMTLMADHNLWQHSLMVCILINPTFLFNIIKVLWWPHPMRKNEWKHHHCFTSFLPGRDPVLRLGPQDWSGSEHLFSLRGSSQLRMAAPRGSAWGSLTLHIVVLLLSTWSLVAALPSPFLDLPRRRLLPFEISIFPWNYPVINFSGA